MYWTRLFSVIDIMVAAFKTFLNINMGQLVHNLNTRGE